MNRIICKMGAFNIFKESVRILPKMYADIHHMNNNSTWDYEQYKIQFGYIQHINNFTRIQDDYEIFNRIGRGKYSEVFNGINVISNSQKVLKVLKPNQLKKLKREIMILSQLKDHPNIISLEDVLYDRGSQNMTLIFEKINNIDFKSHYKYLTPKDVKYIMKEILKGLEYSHSKGIIHRDIKPQNIIIDQELKVVKIIDWGLAEFYLPEKEYNVRVASRYFKGPELLVDFRQYHYSLDIWSLGCLFAGIIFKQEPFFKGLDNEDQLIQIIKVLGSENFNKYLKKYNIDLQIDQRIPNYKQKNLKQFINESNKDFCTPEALDLLNKMLQFDHGARILTIDALKHPYFSNN